MARTKSADTKKADAVHTDPVSTDTPPNVISIQDLQNILIIFDLASNRGAFRGSELEPIGKLYNKLNAFVQAALPPKPVDNTTTSGSTVDSGA